MNYRAMLSLSFLCHYYILVVYICSWRKYLIWTIDLQWKPAEYLNCIPVRILIGLRRDIFREIHFGIISIDWCVCSCWSVSYFFLIWFAYKARHMASCWNIFLERFCILHGSGKYIYCKIRDKEMILFVLIDFILFLFITCFQWDLNYVKIILPSVRQFHCSIYFFLSITNFSVIHCNEWCKVSSYCWNLLSN